MCRKVAAVGLVLVLEWMLELGSAMVLVLARAVPKGLRKAKKLELGLELTQTTSTLICPRSFYIHKF